VTTHLVQGADPALRDREVQRLVDELLDGEDRTLALEEHEILARRRAGDDSAPESPGDGAASEHPTFARVTNALQSPPFMTAHRVVVVREIGNLASEQAKWLAGWIEAGSETTRLVLVSGGGRTPAPLEKAVKAHATVATPGSEQTEKVLARELQGARLRLAPDASERLVRHLGEDAGRVPELVEIFAARYGSDATLALEEIEDYLGDAGAVGPFELTNAIDRGDVATALEVLHRTLTATSTREPKPTHPFQVMAMLVRHYERLLRLDDPAITSAGQAAEALGMRSAAGARFPLAAAQHLGTSGLREAMQLLARAELDLRGYGGADDRTVIDVLVARLAALHRRHQPVSRTVGRSRGRR
jgi:DNA polymerase III subunit delta